MGFEEAFHFGLRTETPAGIAFQRFLDEGGDRLDAHQMLAAARGLLVAIAHRRLKHPIAVHDAGAHAGHGLFGVLAAMLTRKGRFDDFEKIVVGVVRENPLGRFQLAARFGNRIADHVVRTQGPREAVEIIDDDDGLAPAAFEEGKQRLDPGAIRCLASKIIAEH